MNKQFEKNLNDRTEYKPVQITEVIKKSGLGKAHTVPGAKTDYYNVPITYDIETSSFYEDDKKRACMYAWTICVNGLSIIGRTWEEFTTCIKALVKAKHTDYKNRRLIIYVHNLGYEFQFMRKYFNFKKVFSLKSRVPVYAITDTGIEFRCSYILSGTKLENIPKFMHTYEIQKMVGDLDYDKIRHSKTPIDKEETGYIMNDGKLACAYIQEQIETYGTISDIPLTKTGIVRRYAKNKCLASPSYQSIISKLTLTAETYEMNKGAFTGGFTHASDINSIFTNRNVSSFDFSSSYPAVICSEKFPMSAWTRTTVENLRDLKKYLNYYCCLFDLELTNVRKSEKAPDSLLSASRCRVKEGVVLDNGRIQKADRIIIRITNVDFWGIERFYDYDTIRVSNFYIAQKGYLPKELIMCVLELYQKKTELKGVIGKETEYQYYKELLNAFYGMMVTDILRDDIPYHDEWEEPKQKNAGYEMKKYNTNKSRFLFYSWGVFVTAYARKNLIENMYNIGYEDYIYSDTDSVKILNMDKHIDSINAYNEKIKEKLTNMCSYYKINTDMICPKTIKGKEKPLGAFDYEGTYKRFKTLGAKRYLYEDTDGMHITISGVDKKAGVRFLYENALTPYTYGFDEVHYNMCLNFCEGLTFPESNTGKLTHTYIDKEVSGEVTDYLGNTGAYHELSYIHLEPSEYKLGLHGYLSYIKQLFGNVELRR